MCNIYAAPSSVSARNSTTSTSSSSRLNISTPPVAKPKPPPAAAAASETLSERNGEAAKEENKEAVGTKEAAAKASKELEGSLAKLGNNISKADAMAIAEQVKDGKSFLQMIKVWHGENGWVWWLPATMTHEAIACRPPVYSVYQLHSIHLLHTNTNKKKQ